ncbi:unnamed protein product [Urochloa humidicola]
MHVSAVRVGVWTPEMGQGTYAIVPKVTKATHIFLVDAKMSMSAIAAHALQVVFATTRKEDTGVLVEQD